MFPQSNYKITLNDFYVVSILPIYQNTERTEWDITQIIIPCHHKIAVMTYAMIPLETTGKNS